MKHTRRWFWLLSDYKTVREIDNKKALKLMASSVRYRVVSIFKGEFGISRVYWISAREMKQLIPILKGEAQT